MPYTKTAWNAGAAPGISAALLNNLETQYEQALLDGMRKTGDTMTGTLTMAGGHITLPGGGQIIHADIVATKQQYYTSYTRGIASNTLWDATPKYYSIFNSGDNPGASTPTIRVDTQSKTLEFWTNLYIPANFAFNMENGTGNPLTIRADGLHQFIMSNTNRIFMFRSPGTTQSEILMEAEYGVQGASIRVTDGGMLFNVSENSRSYAGAALHCSYGGNGGSVTVLGKLTATLQAADAHTFQAVNFNVASFNRTGSDGSILAFAVNGSYKGAISISGETVLYIAFAGAHSTRLKPGQERPPKYGVLIASGETFTIEDGKPFPYIGFTTTKNDQRVYGVWTDLQSGETEYNNVTEQVASLGLYMVRVCDEDGDIENGDLLTTSTHKYEATKAQPLTGDINIVRASTLGKSLEDVTWAGVEIDSALGYKWKVIPVTLCCG